MQTDPQGKPRKTWKREVAFLLFIWLVYLVETKEPDFVQILTFPIFTFGALAFGMQWYSPNGGMLRNQSTQLSYLRPERSSEYPSGEDQYPKSWHVERYRAEASQTASQNNKPNVRPEQSESRYG